MVKDLLTSSVLQYATIARVSMRDTASAAFGVLLVCAVCWYVGNPQLAVIFAGLILVCEVALRLLFKRWGPFRRLTRRQTILAALVLHVVNIVLYCVPPVYLAGHPSLAIKVTGLLCLVGTQVYLANTWSRVPLFLGAQLAPVIMLLVVALFQMATTPATQSPFIHWAFATAFMFAFIFMTIDTLRQQIVTERALGDAQSEIAGRVAQLEEAQRLDNLTGLLNRSAFDRALHVMLDDRTYTDGEVAVFVVDLDSFKPINDTYSHEAGDAVLIETARRLQTLIGDSGIVGRLGGDEFICTVNDLADAEEVLACGKSIAQAIASPIAWKTRTFKIAASVGAAVTSGDERATVRSLCSCADQAMFAAKSSPNRLPVIYEKERFAPRMTAEDKQRLIEAISDRSLKPYFQSKVHLPTGKVIGFEALTRWHHPNGDLRTPVDFMDQIQELGLQGDFMMSMAQQVVDGITHMLDAGLDPGQVSLNVSEVALATHSGRQELGQIVTDNPRAAKHLTFEITEDVFIARAADTIQASIEGFRAQGVRISLDDFGTGFASFHHLRQLEFDELKIDTSFVAGLGHDATAEVLVRGFLSIASGLGVSVVAEGVETSAQERDLINMGCLTAQGFLYSEAVDLEHACAQLVEQQNTLSAL